MKNLIQIWSLVAVSLVVNSSQAQLTPYVWQQQTNLPASPPDSGLHSGSKPGAGTERLTISKPVTLRAPLGPVTVGL